MVKEHISKELKRPVKLLKEKVCYINTTDLRLEIKESTIKNAGNGVFTKEFIPANTRVGFYEGIVSKDERLITDYTFTLSNKWFVDGSHYPRSYIAMVNDPFNGEFKYNCEFDVQHVDKNGKTLRFKDRRVFLRSIVDIEPGEELFASYGDDYWNCETRKKYLKDDKSVTKKKKGLKKILKKVRKSK